MFIIISGISSSGKNTVISNLIKRNKNLKVLEKSSVTTRVPRKSDKVFNTYVFKSEAEFAKLIEEKALVEHEVMYGNHYGILKEPLDRVVIDKKNDYIRDIDVKGNLSVRRYLDGKCEVISIFIDAPDEVLKERLKQRGDSEEQIEMRLARGNFERGYKKHYDLVIENIDLDKTIETIERFIEKKRIFLR